MDMHTDMNINGRTFETDCEYRIFPGALKAASLRLLLLLPLLVLLLPSCGNEYGTDVQEENPEILFRLKLPADVPQAGTYAMSDSEELQLSSATVLAFAKSVDEGDDDYYFRYMRTGAITQSGQNATITIMPEKGNQRFLVLANCNEELASLESAVSTSDNLAAVLGKLTVVEAQEWPAGNTSDGERPLKPIPMAVLTGEYSIGNGLTTVGDDTPVNLIRMLARIDVSLHEDITNFKLVSACLFNRNDRGYIAYNPESAYWDETNKKVMRAWVPASAQTVENPSSDDYYRAAYTIDDPHGAIRKSIYTFESVGSAYEQTATCIVVGGYYDYPINSTKITYYRLDIPLISNGDILRNHLYGIEIAEVVGEGASTAEDAFNGLAVLQAGITDWDLATYSVDLTGSQDREKPEYLSISKVSLFYLRPAVSDQTVSVTSTQSWTASSLQTWITGVTPSGGTGTQNLSFSLQENGTGIYRTGYIAVTSGNLATRVRITQSKDEKLAPAFSDGVAGTAGTYSPGGASSVRSFTVTYHSQWRVAKIADPGNVVKMLYSTASTGTVFPSTETFRFAITGNTSANPAVIRFTSPTGAFDPVDVSIKVQ
jgi:hypothetical protein